jgi:exodeoxyribonuclease V beta subunit
MRTPGNLAPFIPTEALNGKVTLLEASAGTGKTHSITWLFLRLITEPQADGISRLPASSILVVTFTEAATAELRDRIRTSLRDARTQLEQSLDDDNHLPSDPVVLHIVQEGRGHGDLIDRLQAVRNALDSFDEVTISTIHGFCQRMLNQNAFESGAEFGAQLMADGAALLDEVVLDFWSRKSHDLSIDRLATLNKCGFDAMRKLAAATTSDPEIGILPPRRPLVIADPARLLGAAADFKVLWDKLAAPANDELLDYVNSRKLSGTKFKTSKIAEAFQALTDWVASPDPATAAATHLRYLGFSNLSSSLNMMNSKTKERYPPPAQQKELYEACDRLADIAEDHDAASKQEESAWLLDTKHELVEFARHEIENRKARRHVLSFDDLLRDLRKALAGAGSNRLRRAIEAQFQVAIIDEFQDTDPVQWGIFRTIFADAKEDGTPAPGRIFLIGDPKQAIYAFRQADIATYLDAGQNADVRRTLKRNWRSDGRLVDALNHLYDNRRLPGAFADQEIGYIEVDVHERQKEDRLRYCDGAPANTPMRIAFVPQGDRARPIPKDEATTLIAGWVASDVASFLARRPEIFDGDPAAWRPAHPGDLAVLVRTHNQGASVQQAMRRLGIPSIRKGQDQVMLTDEARELIDFLEAVLGPGDRRTVHTALATRFLGMSANELAAQEGNDNELDGRINHLSELANVWREHGFIRMFRMAMGRARLVQRLLGQDDGERRVTNYLHVAELLNQEAASSFLRPEGLLSWLRRQRTDAADSDEARERVLRLESDAKAVQIVTIHGCKGLQYPVTWCPFLWDGKLLPMHPSQLKFHDNTGVFLDIEPGGMEWDMHFQAAQAETFAENQRLAYVAMTRARHATTIVTGGISSLGTSPLGLLFHAPHGIQGSAVDVLAGLKEPIDSRSDEDRRKDIGAIVATSKGTMEILEVAENRVARFHEITGDSSPLKAREWGTYLLDHEWRKASFSTLMRHDNVPLAIDEDNEQQNPERSTPESGKSEKGTPAGKVDNAGLLPTDGLGHAHLAKLPKGEVSGNCLHDIFERIDFCAPDPRQWDAVIDARLRYRGLDPSLRDDVRLAIERILSTPLGLPDEGGVVATGGPRLRDTTTKDRWNEMEFFLPVSGGFDTTSRKDHVTRKRIAEVFRETQDGRVGEEYARHLEGIRLDSFRGFLTGKIDLVFRASQAQDPADATWYVVDYKSNFLGDWFGDYAPDRLATSMQKSNYHLQYHFYLVALHRYLKLRLGASYSADRHLGGVYYLFLRGMRGHQEPGDCGVFRYRPPTSRIQALSEVFESRIVTGLVEK